MTTGSLRFFQLIFYFIFPKKTKNPWFSDSEIYLWRKVVCFVLFCFVCTYEIHWTGTLQIAFLGLVGKLLRRTGASAAWFHGTWTCCTKKFSSIEWFSSLKNKLNHSWNFRRNWNVPLVLLERSWWAGFNGIYLVRFGFRMWGRYWFLGDFCHWKFK